MININLLVRVLGGLERDLERDLEGDDPKFVYRS